MSCRGNSDDHFSVSHHDISENNDIDSAKNDSDYIDDNTNDNDDVNDKKYNADGDGNDIRYNDPPLTAAVKVQKQYPVMSRFYPPPPFPHLLRETRCLIDELP